MKYGLGDSYDNVSVLPVKLRAWLDLTKPASSLGIGGAFILGSLFFFYFTNQPDNLSNNYFNILYATFTIMLAHGASQTMNMAEDAEMDSRTEHKQDRPIPSGIVSVEEARTLAWILILIALGRGYLVNETFGILMTVLIFMGVFYNLDPIRAKERIISIPWQAVSRGLMMFPIIWSAYDTPWKPTPWLLGLFMFFYVLGFQNSADIIDREIDAKYGISTFVVVFGVRQTVIIAFGCTMAMITTIAVSVKLSLLPIKMLSMLLIVPLCLYMVQQMWEHPYKISDKTGNHPAWLIFYAGMVLCIAIPLTTELLI